MTWLEAIEASTMAQAVATSRWAPAILSSLHLIGLTLVLAGAVGAHLRLAGLLFPDAPLEGMTRPASRLLLYGLVVSLATGVMLVLPRVSSAVVNPFFRAKMLLLLTGLAVQFTMIRRVTVPLLESTRAGRALGYVGLVVWVGVAAAGCGFILLE